MTELQRCSNCKCMKLLSLFKVRENTGQIHKTCIQCGERYKDKDGGVYKLFCKDPHIKDFYIGSTINLERRKKEHKSVTDNINSKDHQHLVYKCIRQNGGWDNWTLQPLEVIIPNLSKKEREIIERKWIELEKPTLNILIPTRSQKESYEANIEYYKEYQRNYREENKDKIKQDKKNYEEKNKEREKARRKKVYDDNKEEILAKCKVYRTNNKQKKAESDKKYVEKNREKVLLKKKEYYEKNKEKVVCECGSEVDKMWLSKHRKTQKHLDIMNNVG